MFNNGKIVLAAAVLQRAVLEHTSAASPHQKLKICGCAGPSHWDAVHPCSVIGRVGESFCIRVMQLDVMIYLFIGRMMVCGL